MSIQFWVQNRERASSTGGHLRRESFRAALPRYLDLKVFPLLKTTKDFKEFFFKCVVSINFYYVSNEKLRKF